MGILDRVWTLKWRRDALLLAENLPESSRFYLTEEAGPHVEAAFAHRLKSRVAAEYHWACADFYVAFVEDDQRHRAAMVEDGRLCLAD
jgi:hypothetical protein